MRYFGLITLFFIITSFFKLNAQVCDSKQHLHKPLNEKLAFDEFRYADFMKELVSHTKKYGYDLEKDECLRNFYFVQQANLVHDIFNLYIEQNTTPILYKSLYGLKMAYFKEQLNLFISNEAQLRSGYAKIKQSQLNSSAAISGTNPTPQASCTNMDFEAGNLSGWSTSSLNDALWSGTNSAYVTTPGPDPIVASINQVFNGGFSACIDVLGSGGDLDWREIKQTFLVTPSNKDFVFYVAVIIDGGSHTCASNPFFNVSVTDASNNTVPCSAVSLIGSGAGGASCSSFTGWNTSGFYDFLPWTPVIVPLGAYVGQNVTIKFRVTRCNGGGGHGARAYLEANCNPAALSATGNLICPGKFVKLNAPNISGYNYNWSGPSGFTASSYSVTPALSGVYSVTMALTSNPSCKMVLDTVLTSVPSPTANFNYTVTPCISTYTVPFDDASTPASGDPITSYNWIWGDATANGSGSNTNHTYLASGTKTVELKIQSTAGCRDSITQTINIQSLPSANFSFTNVCFGSSAAFNSSSLAPPPAVITSQDWFFGDGLSSSGTSASHSYSVSGTYPVKLVVSNNQTCKDSVTQNVIIYPKPIVSFSATPVCLNLTTVFTNSTSINSPGSISSSFWDFNNDGVTDNTTVNPTNIFTTPGVFPVELKAVSGNGCKDSLTVNVQVYDMPTAIFTANNACLYSAISINNTSSVALPESISNYNWNFGSGAQPSLTSSLQSPSAVSYSLSGVKNITLSISTVNSCTAAVTQTIEIYPKPVANFSVTSVCQSTATAFTDLSTPTGSITSWAWDFTNNNSIDNSTSAPTNLYSNSGTFTTALIVTSNNNCKDTFELPVEVWGHTIPDFTPDKVCFGSASSFTNLTNTTSNANVGSVLSYLWDFADGTLTTSVNSPSHTYTSAVNANAVFNVKLKSTSTNGCVDSIVKPVNVYAIPTASFTSDSVCFGLPTQLTDLSNGNGNTVDVYMWDFSSDASIDVISDPNPNFIFPSYGSNLVTYTVLTSPAAGLVCSNVTNSITVWVNPNPVPDFTFANKCINAQPNAFDGFFTTIAIGTNTAYVWAYGDGQTSSSNPTATSSHSFSAAGVYNTTLTVTSNKGCSKDITKQVEVYQKPFMRIANSSACDQAAMTFTAQQLPGSGTVNTWLWDFNHTITSIETTGQNTGFTFSGPGSQTVALVSETTNGCRDTMNKIVYVNYVPVALFNVDDPDGCPEHCVTFTDLTLPITGPAKINKWEWTLGDGVTATNTSNSNVDHCYGNSSSNQLALYDVKLVLTTDSGCVSLPNNKLEYITVFPKPIAKYVVNPNVGSIITPLEYFINQSQDYTKWWWSFGDGPFKSDSVNVNPTHFYSDVTATTYYTNLQVVNQYGCTDIAFVAVEIAPEYTFYIPNAFTPTNSDGINDYFTGIGIGIAKYEMWIYDRWGEKLYYTDDITKGWDGKVKGETQEGKQDIYIWKVKLRDVLGQKHDYVGHVTLLK